MRVEAEMHSVHVPVEVTVGDPIKIVAEGRVTAIIEDVIDISSLSDAAFAPGERTVRVFVTKAEITGGEAA